MNNIKKTLVLGLVAVATAFGFSTEAQAATKTLSVGQTCSLSLKINGRYVKPVIVSCTSDPSGVLSYTKYSALSSGKYFMKVTVKKAGTATIKVRYGNKYYYFYFQTPKPTVVTPSWSRVSSTKYDIYCGKQVNAISYRLRVCKGSSNYYRSSVISTSTTPRWRISNATRGVKYYYWIDVLGADGKFVTNVWHGNTIRWRSVTR